jgi:hypothetical protein
LILFFAIKFKLASEKYRQFDRNWQKWILNARNLTQRLNLRLASENMADKKVILGYWGIAGFTGVAQACRYLLSIVGANW